MIWKIKNDTIEIFLNVEGIESQHETVPFN